MNMAEGEDFGQEKPPLLVTVKRLLDKYPDGQIFKVCRCVKLIRIICGLANSRFIYIKFISP